MGTGRSSNPLVASLTSIEVGKWVKGGNNARILGEAPRVHLLKDDRGRIRLVRLVLLKLDLRLHLHSRVPNELMNRASVGRAVTISSLSGGAQQGGQ